MNRYRIARYAGLVCLAGSVIQILYGALAVVFPHPAIIEPRYTKPSGHSRTSE